MGLFGSVNLIGRFGGIPEVELDVVVVAMRQGLSHLVVGWDSPPVMRPLVARLAQFRHCTITHAPTLIEALQIALEPVDGPSV